VDLKVTDAFLYGDQFQVYDNGVALGLTSTPGTGPGTTDPDVAYADPGYSKGLYALGAGNHSVTFQAVQSPFGSGGAYFRADVVPEPGTLTMLGLAMTTLAGYRARRSKR
jgi:hypothetical protein